MICSVCRLFDACKTAWMTEHLEPEEQKDVERRLRELWVLFASAMLWGPEPNHCA